ncbi:MAG: putative quinol monooxygenase [Dehalococcoidia bacterium]
MTTTTLWRLKVKPESQAEFEALVSQLVRDVHANEPGHVFEYRRSKADALTYILFLSFFDEAAFKRYGEAPWHRGASPAIMACLAEPPVAEHLDTF